METKYMLAFENFDQTTERVAVELRPSETIKEIWNIIDSGDFYCIISAYYPGNDPDTLADEHEQLKKDILKMNYSYLEQSYGYQYSDGNGLTTVSRKSLVVPSMDYHELLALGKKWKQETIAFGGNYGVTVVRVADQKVLLDMKMEDMKLAWNFLLTNQRNIPW